MHQFASGGGPVVLTVQFIMAIFLQQSGHGICAFSRVRTRTLSDLIVTLHLTVTKGKSWTHIAINVFFPETLECFANFFPSYSDGIPASFIATAWRQIVKVLASVHTVGKGLSTHPRPLKCGLGSTERQRLASPLVQRLDIGASNVSRPLCC